MDSDRRGAIVLGTQSGKQEKTSSGSLPARITAATIGTIEDLGVTDVNNMGAAMAPVDVKLTP